MATGEAERTRSHSAGVGLVSGALDTPVATKLVTPIPSAGLLPRTHLVTQLAESHGRLCLISAPAGWGKTSLLAAWYMASTARERFAFLRLEPSDDDSRAFWVCLVAALRSVLPDIAEDAEQTLHAPAVDPMRRVVPSLVNELATLEEPLLIVLDDYHVVTRQAIHASILYLIDHLPPLVRLVIATRADPPLSLGRLRASGELAEVRAAQLRLTETEAAQLLRERFDLDLDEHSVQLLCERTEGWPAALHLAGLSLRSEPNHREFIEQFAGDDRNVADYLTGEVLSHLPDTRRDFLLRSSVLDRLSGPLCDTVLDFTNSVFMLDELERDNLFLLPLDNRRRWYRYHHLFGDWLKHELRKTEPGIVTELHSRASAWYAGHGFPERAVTHAIASGNQDQAATLLDRYLTDWAHVNWSEVQRWLDQIPEAIAAAHPMAAIANVMTAWMQGDFTRGFRWIGTAEAALGEVPEELRDTASTMVALFRAFGELLAGDMDAARRAFEEIVDQERPSASPAFAMASENLGIATFWSVGALEAITPLQEGVVAREQSSKPDSGATAHLAAAYAEIGDWSAAETTAMTALRLSPPFPGYEYPYRMAAHYALGQVLIARGERYKGIGQIEQGLAQARRWVEPIFIAYGCLLLADACDGFSEKRALVREARQVIAGNRGRGRIGDMVTAAERKLSMRRPQLRSAGTVHVETLTERELDVLRLLRSALTLPQIATELYISYNTAKGYTKSIYRKLGVTSRASAVETASELDLV